MTNRFKDSFFNLANSKQWIFLKLFDCKYFIYIFAKIHPFNSFLPSSSWINSIALNYLFEFIVIEIDV